MSMLTILLIIAAYIVVTIGFIAWDAFIGLPWEFDGHENPPIALVAFFWPISIWFCFFAGIANQFTKVKEKRLDKEKIQERLRIATEKEIENYIEEVEEEIKKMIHK